jgi:proline iminopeptidase
MPYAETRDGTRLYYEETGSGTPLVFVHEFGGDHRSWEMQMRYFSRRYRCVAYAARGYTPSDVPEAPDAYSYMHMANDLVDLLDHLNI